MVNMILVNLPVNILLIQHFFLIYLLLMNSVIWIMKIALLLFQKKGVDAHNSCSNCKYLTDTLFRILCQYHSIFNPKRKTTSLTNCILTIKPLINLSIPPLQMQQLPQLSGEDNQRGQNLSAAGAALPAAPWPAR